MAFKNLSAFGAGELTPELYERGNLDKFRTGLARLRNATVTKMGGLKSRQGTRYLFTSKSNAAAKYLYIASKNTLFEFTNHNLRVKRGFDPETYTFTSSSDIDLTLYPAGDDVTLMHFAYGNKYLFLFADGKETLRFDIDLLSTFPLPPGYLDLMRNLVAPYAPAWWFNLPNTTIIFAAGTTPPTGYDIDYTFTYVYDGIETFNVNVNSTLKKPVLTGEYNTLTITTNKPYPTGVPIADEVRVYQRPRNGGTFHYVGNAFPVEAAGTVTYSFRDAGVQIVPTDQPPEYVATFMTDTRTSTGSPGVYIYPPQAKTGIVYQDRLIFSGTRTKNRVFGTKTGTTAMTRDFPLQADSAVGFRVGSDGGLKIQRFFDGRGLLMFTTVGVYETPAQILTPETAYAIKRGPYIATDKIEPLQLGEFVTIYDERLKAVIGLTPTGSDQGFAYTEFSIFSSHLLKGKKIVSWALADGETQILWMVLDDGLVLSFSFQNEQLLRSWAWHDFKDGIAEEVFVMDIEGGRDVVCFLVNRGGTRSVEALTDRDIAFVEYVGSDASVIYKANLLQDIASPTATVAPVTPGVWDGPLTITPAFSGFGSVVNDVIRIYVDEYEYIDLTVTANTLGVLTVTPNAEYPSTMGTVTIDQGIWQTYNTLTGLSHLNGKKVAVRVDGFTHASPLNTEKDYDEYTVTGGSITLNNDVRGAFVSVGLPIVTDIQTLEVDTVEQSPTKLEGEIVNKLWLSYFESLFLYAGSELPADDTVTGMENQEYQVEPDDGISNLIPPLPISERLEMQIQGDWKVKGSVALRNVDPQPIGLRAIIPDVEVIRN